MPDVSNRATTGDEPKFAPLCIWCSAEWSDSNVELYAWAGSGCPTCGPEASAELRITCHACGKLMYSKEYI